MCTLSMHCSQRHIDRIYCVMIETPNITIKINPLRVYSAQSNHIEVEYVLCCRVLVCY